MKKAKIIYWLTTSLVAVGNSYAQSNLYMKQNENYTYATVPTRFVEANGIQFESSPVNCSDQK